MRKNTKQMWVRKIFQDRHLKGEFHLLVNELRLFDHELFFVCFRMSPSTFEELLSWVAPHIIRQTTDTEHIGFIRYSGDGRPI